MKASHQSSAPASGAPAGAGHGSIIRVDLDRLAGIVGCSVDELSLSLKKERVSDIQGVKLKQGETGLFQLHDATPLYPPPEVQEALITMASRPNELDTETTPRQLLVLGGPTGMTVIEILLYNLVRAGVQRAVLLTGCFGQRIRQHVEASPIFEKMAVEFIELGEEWDGFHAESILAARDAFKDGPFLLCCSDHSFDPGIIHEMADAPASEWGYKGWVLVETDMTEREKKALPPTAVSVRFKAPSKAANGHAQSGQPAMGHSAALEIGRGLLEPKRGSHIGLEAGLFTLTTDVFLELERLKWEEGEEGYYSLSDALSAIAERGDLCCVPTMARAWLALETRDQVEHTEEELQNLLEGGNILPWQCQAVLNSRSEALQRLIEAAGDDFATTGAEAEEGFGRVRSFKSLLIGLPTPDSAISTTVNNLRGADYRGFVVPCPNIESSGPGLERAVRRPSQGPVKRDSSPQRVNRTPALIDFGRTTSFPKHTDVESGRLSASPPRHSPGAFYISMPPPPHAHEGREALLIPLGSSVQGQGPSFLFAVPDPSPATPMTSPPNSLHVEAGRPGGLPQPSSPHRTPRPSEQEGSLSSPTRTRQLTAVISSMIPHELPSDIQRVQIQAAPGDVTKGQEEVGVQVVLSRQVPLVGWLITLVALCGTSMLAPMGHRIDNLAPHLFPGCKSFWRFSCSLVMYLPWFMLVASKGQLGAQLVDPLLMIPNLVAGAALAAWSTLFYCALQFTSVANATLFGTTAPLMLVLWRLGRGEPIAPMERWGVAIAVVGAGLCGLGREKASRAADIDSVHNTIGICLALASAVGSAVYFVNAKAVRPRISVALFVFSGRLVCAAMTFLFVLGVFVLEYGWRGGLHRVWWTDSGAFGWIFSPEVLGTQVLTCLLTDMCGTFAFFLALKYVDPLLVSVVSLAGPMVAVVESTAMGQAVSTPSTWYFGDAVLVCGASLVIFSSLKQRQEVFDATAATKIQTGLPLAALHDPPQDMEDSGLHVKLLSSPTKSTRPPVYGAVN